MLQQLFEQILVVLILLCVLSKYISDGIRRRDPRRTERPPSLGASSSSSTNPQGTPSPDASSSSASNPQDTYSLDASSSSSTNPQDTPPPDASSSSSTNPQDTPSPDASSSSASNPRDNYDVFLSFTYRDGTGNGFTSHLYKDLVQKGNDTFLDVKRLERGEDISPELDKAIEGSRCAVVVVSEKYASSRWCMDELLQILKCRKDSKIKQIVLPIFYHVNAGLILEKEKKGPIWEGLQSLKEKLPVDDEKFESWTDALIELANIAGESVNKSTNEAQFIEDFIKMVSSKLIDPALLNISEDLVGMESQLEKLKLFVSGSRSSSGDVRFIGICGLRGVGKTTLSQAYLKYMSGQFRATSFLENVRETCKKKHNGLLKLQKQLLRDVLKGEHRINNVSEGKDMISKRLRRKKILVVLDDVDHLSQLQGLAGKNDWFDDGSQIIVTTTDESLLRSMYGDKEYIIHKVDELEDSEALQLFSLKAFKSDCPPKDYRKQSAEVIEYARGLPLALVILGSYLRGKTTDEWGSTLGRLKEHPEKEIMDVLQISFDRLRETEKNIFLDIACFFNGYPKDYVMNIMSSCGFFPEIGIRSLVDKNLLRMDHGRNILRMHDLLEELGKKIVREESRDEPGRRSRIWLEDDLYHVLNEETGTKEVKAIMCDYMEPEKISTFRGFSNMKNLRLLIAFSEGLLLLESDHPPDIDYLSNELRLLDWRGFPLKSFPQSFRPLGLFELSLNSSKIERLWDSPLMKPLNNLKSIDLSHSKSIRKLEKFSLFPNLEKLILDDCYGLEEIDPSITVLKRLTLLSLGRCRSLKSLPTSMAGLKNLKVLYLSGCSSLGNLPEDSMCSDEDSVVSDEDPDVTGHDEDSVGSDEDPDVTGHDELQSYGWKNIWNIIVGNGLPSAGLSCLEKLHLRYCNLSDGAFPDDFGCLGSLEYLDLSVNEFSCLPSHFNQLSKLRHLDLSDCQNLKSLCAELPNSLESININYCEELHTFLDPLSQCNLHCSAIYCASCYALVNRQGSKRTAMTSLGRYLQNPPKPSKTFDIFLLGNEIPSWFTDKFLGRSSISFPLDLLWCTSKWMGFALSVCFRTLYPEIMSKCFWEIKINQEDWGFGPVYPPSAVAYNNNHIWLIYLPRDTYFRSEWQEKFGDVQFSFKSPGKGEIEQCGVRLVYEKDIEELNQIARVEPMEPPVRRPEVRVIRFPRERNYSAIFMER